LGIEFTLELLEQALDYLSPTGVAPIYTSDPILKKGPYLAGALTQKFGHLPLEFTQINIFRSHPNTDRQRQHFYKHNMVAFDDCVLVVRSASRFAVRKQAWHPAYYWRSKLLRFNHASDPAISTPAQDAATTPAARAD
jgi:hypothetical protein